MKSFRFLALAALAAGMMAGRPAAFADPATQPAITTQQSTNDDRVAEAVAAIDSAADPSAVVEAYAKAQAIAPGTVDVQRAYVRRLVALNLPELAETQARDLTERVPDDGVAWAVAAYMDARRGNMADAMEKIVKAAQHAPDDAFVQRTAGQLLAYHDRNADRVKFGYDLTTALANMRQTLGGKPEYNRAYSDAYARDTSTGPTTVEGDQDYLPPPSDESAYREPVPPSRYDTGAYRSGYYYGNGFAYTDPYYIAYPARPWWPSYWWWGSSVVIIDDPFFRHHHHHHRFDHHDFDNKHFDRDSFRHRSVDRRFDDRFNNRFNNNRVDSRFNHPTPDHDRFDRGSARQRMDPRDSARPHDRFRTQRSAPARDRATATPSQQRRVDRQSDRSSRPARDSFRSSPSRNSSDGSRGDGSRGGGSRGSSSRGGGRR